MEAITKSVVLHGPIKLWIHKQRTPEMRLHDKKKEKRECISELTLENKIYKIRQPHLITWPKVIEMKIPSGFRTR